MSRRPPPPRHPFPINLNDPTGIVRETLLPGLICYYDGVSQSHFTNPPQFSISSKILSSIGRLEAAREVIENAPLIPTYERQFEREAVNRTVHHATALEGNSLNFTEVRKILEGGEDHGVIARERDVQEVINYRKAIDFIDQLVKSGTKRIDEETIRRANAIITEKIVESAHVGIYRRVGAISRNSLTLATSMVWPDPQAIPALVAALVAWAGSLPAVPLHPVLRAGILHTWFVLIHPFEEGNGRTARALSTLSLGFDNYNIRNFFSLEEYYDSDAQHYYDSIMSVVKSGGDYSQWLEYFCEGLAIEYNRIKERVLKLSRDVKIKESVGGQIALSERQEKIIEHLQNFGRLVNAEFVKLFPNLSEDTVLREVSDLIKKNILIKKGKTKAARYELK